MFQPADTICAIGTARDGAARGMVRVSGANVVAVIARVFAAADGAPLDVIKKPSVIMGRLNLARGSVDRWRAAPLPDHARGEGGFALACDLYLWPGSRSYTREPVAELHTIGSPPLLEAVLERVCAAGARLAEPGEFTLRAFLAGRLDLTQAEAVLGVIDARDENDLHVALAQLAGGLARPLHRLRDDLLQLLAELEAGLDFVEEEIQFISHFDVLARLQAASAMLSGMTEQLDLRRVSQELPEVVLIGPPNVGKSSLFNALVEQYGEQADANRAAAPALVSPRGGTTRDYLTATLSLGNHRCMLIDTAGIAEIGPLSDAKCSIDAEAQEVAAERLRRATVCVCCIEANTWNVSEQRIRDQCVMRDCDVILLTKADLSGNSLIATVKTLRSEEFQNLPVIATSSHTRRGLDVFARELQALLERESPRQCRDVIAVTAERCRDSIHRAGESLEAAANLVIQHAGDELVASDIRVALAELGKVVGAVYTDDLLDRIFKSFCIGK